MERAREQISKLVADAAAFVAYYERTEQQLQSSIPTYDAWLGELKQQQRALDGMKGMRRQGLHFVRKQLAAGRAALQKLKDAAVRAGADVG